MRSRSRARAAAAKASARSAVPACPVPAYSQVLTVSTMRSSRRRPQGSSSAARVPLGVAVVDAGPAERGEGDRVAAGLGEGVPPVAESVGPPVEPELGGGGVFAKIPGGRDEPLV